MSAAVLFGNVQFAQKHPSVLILPNRHISAQFSVAKKPVVFVSGKNLIL